MRPCVLQGRYYKDRRPDVQINTYNNLRGLVQDLADPFVLEYKGRFYLYGTSDTQSNKGIPAYVSDDLVNWKGPTGATNGFAVSGYDVWGEKWFWAGDVIHYNNQFYMYLTAEEHLVVAVSDSPLGPFKQNIKKPMHEDIKEIDGSVFEDDNGKIYIYFVRFDNGNVVYGAQLSEDLLSMKEETITECLRTEQQWEFDKHEPRARVNEGSFMVKHKGVYYLTYTANHFASIDYAVGYATSVSPLGPWEKFKGNPILTRNEKIGSMSNSVGNRT